MNSHRTNHSSKKFGIVYGVWVAAFLGALSIHTLVAYAQLNHSQQVW